MPLVRVETNAVLHEAILNSLRQGLASAVGGMAGCGPAGTRVEIAGGRNMRMAGLDDEPLVHVEIRDVDFPKDRAAELTAAICPVLSRNIGVAGGRVYIAVVSNRNSMWRVNGLENANK